MTTKTLPDYDGLNMTLRRASLAVTGAELHGMLMGFVVGGITPQDNAWQPVLFDYTNEGMGWPSDALAQAATMMEVIVQELKADEFSVSLCLPADDEKTALSQRAEALAEWTNSFLAGLGLSGSSLDALDNVGKECLSDLKEIGKVVVESLDDQVDDEDTQQAFDIVTEHVKVCVLTLFTDLGRQAPKAKTIH
ncbi:MULTISPECIES: UPF0149 family protein [unclassified Vibrio]|uniref:UPF0149 family protein n=1 Tax=Vibrio sp. HB236076 TaxID=3232307 RepID=A0AB39HDA2_9VIBR|nr:UPF0149 family protein [Vibrio sp. HB161653]MDP5253939.1 UPF0149 family protein [Vibrio sp. HB161653]